MIVLLQFSGFFFVCLFVCLCNQSWNCSLWLKHGHAQAFKVIANGGRSYNPVIIQFHNYSIVKSKGQWGGMCVQWSLLYLSFSI